MTEERPIDRRFRRFDLNDTRPRSEPVAKCPGGTVRSYRTRTFQEEYLAFLKKHGAHFDEKYLWDQLRPIIPCPTGRFFRRTLPQALRAWLRSACPSGTKSFAHRRASH